ARAARRAISPPAAPLGPTPVSLTPAALGCRPAPRTYRVRERTTVSKAVVCSPCSDTRNSFNRAARCCHDPTGARIAAAHERNFVMGKAAAIALVLMLGAAVGCSDKDSSGAKGGSPDGSMPDDGGTANGGESGNGGGDDEAGRNGGGSGSSSTED